MAGQKFDRLMFKWNSIKQVAANNSNSNSDSSNNNKLSALAGRPIFDLIAGALRFGTVLFDKASSCWPAEDDQSDLDEQR